MLTTGARLGPYEVIAQIGSGGMGEVYRARDTRLGRDVAIKVLPAEFAADAERLRRFEREAKATAALSHPNILDVHDVGTHESVPYLVEELLEGESLRDRLTRGPIPVREAAEIAVQVAHGLAAAHGKHIVHRDLKPANVFITKEGIVKILDFGIAKLVESVPVGEADTLTHAPTGATDLGRVLGTIAYMAPEQGRGMPVDPRADIFSFGCVLYEMLSGERPFRGETATDTMAAILKDEPAVLPATVPPSIAAVVTRCLAKDPGERYQRAAEVRSALEVAQLSSQAAEEPRRKPAARLKARAGRARIGALAVLPLLNLSNDPEQEYFVDGMTEVLTAELACLRGLRVISRTSAMRYRGSAKSIPEIGAELNVDGVVEGSVLRAGDRVRITAQLIHAASDAHLWAGNFQRDLTDVLALQGEIAGAIASEIGLRLSAPERARLARARPVVPAAFEACLIGSYEWRKLTPAGLDAAQHAFEQALAADPSYASAHQGLACVWGARQQMGFVPPAEAVPRAKAAALEAVRLDPGCAEAHWILAGLTTWADWDWAGAEPEWRRALELNPNDATTHAYYAHFLMAVGRVNEAWKHSALALELDPFNALLHALAAVERYFERRYDEALAVARKSLSLQPNHPCALLVEWLAGSATGRHAEALAALRAYLDVLYGDAGVLEALDAGGAEGGHVEAYRRAAAALADRHRRTYTAPFDIASVYAGANDGDAALDWLERGFEARDGNTPYLGMPLFDLVRSTPRFQALVRRIGFPQSS